MSTVPDSTLNINNLKAYKCIMCVEGNPKKKPQSTGESNVPRKLSHVKCHIRFGLGFSLREAQRLRHPCFLQVERVNVQEHQVKYMYGIQANSLG